jgi:hypothetical protein
MPSGHFLSARWPIFRDVLPPSRVGVQAIPNTVRLILRSLPCLAVFAEVYGDVRVIEARLRERRLSHVFSWESLQLVPLDNPGVQKRLGPDGRIGMVMFEQGATPGDQDHVGASSSKGVGWRKPYTARGAGDHAH